MSVNSHGKMLNQAKLMVVSFNQLDFQDLFCKLKVPSVTACSWELKALKVQAFGEKLYFHLH